MNPEIPDFHKARVLVVGDLMLDRYWIGEARRVSPEAPVPVVSIVDTDNRPGGAGNVALNIAALGAKCTLLAVVGDDEAGHTVTQSLQLGGVQNELLVPSGFSTLIKLRVLSQHQQLIRLDFENDIVSVQPALRTRLQQLVADCDIVVFSDYGKGTLSAVQQLIAMCRDAGKTILLDPKGDDYSHYAGADLLTPNFNEFQQIVGTCQSENEIHTKAAQLIQQLNLRGLLITRSEAGMNLIMQGRDAIHIMAQTREVFDVTGAGDTVVATLAAALASGLNYEHATRLANTAAGIVVSRLGSATVTPAELKHALHGDHQNQGILTEDELLAAVAAAKANGETIVMTNGCFDILHAGHVHYLHQAAALGDRLIVAVNTDATVRALKGEHRPVNDLQTRITVLAGLAAVDWVIAFSEETPQRLICAVKPDLLVKGGDNAPDSIPGAACVREQGGQVKVLDYLHGCSTTQIIERIKTAPDHR